MPKRTIKDMPTDELILIPLRIQSRCIINAKSSAAKQILVRLALHSLAEDVKRIYMRGYGPKLPVKSFFQTVKDIFS